MTKPTHVHPSDLRAFSRLAIDATLGLTDLVEAMHHNIASFPGPLGAQAQGPTRGITGLVYQSIRGVTNFVGGGIDALLAQLVPLFGVRTSSPEREAMLAALNGVMGDYLAATGNPLAISMDLRRNAGCAAGFKHRCATTAAFSRLLRASLPLPILVSQEALQGSSTTHSGKRGKMAMCASAGLSCGRVFAMGGGDGLPELQALEGRPIGTLASILQH